MENMNFVATLNNSVGEFEKESILLEHQSKELHEQSLIAKGKALGISSAINFIYKNGGVICAKEEPKPKETKKEVKN